MRLRFPMLLPLALLIVCALFWLMQWMIRPGEIITVEPEELPGVEIVRIEEEDPQREQADMRPESSPPPPPPAPPALARPDLPSLNVPVPSTPELSEVAVPLSFAGARSMSGSAFGGFAGRGQGAGDGWGTGRGFVGRELIPLSTARPMMPEWACEQEIRGWVEVVFTVMPNGRVRDVRIIDAEPRGVYEESAIASVSNWIYSSNPRAREVKQRVEMDPADCAFDYR